jgi:hypothetical protein
MKLKSLLLGSAAALFAVTGARAADAVVIPEPEVVEYVRVCDAAGTGFFYIPGTETCLRVHGYVRYEMGFGDLNSVSSATGDETWNKRARFTLRTSTWAETDWGPLTTFTETRLQWDTNDTVAGYTNDYEFEQAHAWIDLNGLRVGVSDSYFTTFTGYGGAVINDTTGGGYGPFRTNFLAYTWTGGAVTATLALEEGATNTSTAYGGPGFQQWGIDDYTPHVVAGLGYDAGIVNLRGVFAYDSRDGAVIAGVDQQGGWAAKLRADVDITDNFSAFVMGMYGENTSGYTTWGNGAAGQETWSVLGGASLGLTDTMTFNTQVQWAESNATFDDEWAVAANVSWDVAPGLTVTPEVQYRNADDGVAATDDDAWGGIVRIQRSF